MKTVWNRNFFPVLLTYFIDNFGLAIVYPIFTPLFLKPKVEILGLGFTFLDRTFLLGLLIASFPLAQFFGAPLFGDLSDRMGRKKVFMMTISGGILGYVLTGLGIHYGILGLLWTGRAMTGFFAGNLTLCLAAIADTAKVKKDRSRNFGWVAILGGMGFVLAILVGGSLSNSKLSDFFRPEVPFFITAGLSAINLGLMIKFFRESHTNRHHDKIDFFKGLKNIGSAITTKKVRLIYLVYFLFMVGWVTSMQFLSTYLIHVFHVSINMITFTFVCIGIIWSLANFLLNPILTRFFSSSKTLLISLTFLSIFLYLTLIPREPLFLFLTHFFLMTLFAALAWTNGLATISTEVSAQVQGRILGVNQSIVAIASIVGPIIGGVIAGTHIHKLYLFTASCALFGAVLLFIRAFGIKKA